MKGTTPSATMPEPAGPTPAVARPCTSSGRRSTNSPQPRDSNYPGEPLCHPGHSVSRGKRRLDAEADLSTPYPY
jgi:hypothetical protein